MHYPLPTQRIPAHAETTPDTPRLFEATTPSRGRLLIEVWDDRIQVKQRIGQRWSAPFQVEEL